jgi:hypothetical protein
MEQYYRKRVSYGNGGTWWSQEVMKLSSRCRCPGGGEATRSWEGRWTASRHQVGRANYRTTTSVCMQRRNKERSNPETEAENFRGLTQSLQAKGGNVPYNSQVRLFPNPYVPVPINTLMPEDSSKQYNRNAVPTSQKTYCTSITKTNMLMLPLCKSYETCK